MTNIHPTLSVIKLNVKGLNTPIKGKIDRKDFTIMIQLNAVYKGHTLDSDTNRLKIFKK